MQFSVSSQVIDKKIKLSSKFKDAIKEEFEGMNCRLEVIINNGGVQTGKVELKL